MSAEEKKFIDLPKILHLIFYLNYEIDPSDPKSIKCPLCKGSELMINTVETMFYCNSCKKGGDRIYLIALFYQISIEDAVIKAPVIALEIETGDLYITIKRAAKFLKVSPNTLRNWEAKGKIKVSRNPINNHRYFRQSYLNKLFKEIYGE